MAAQTDEESDFVKKLNQGPLGAMPGQPPAPWWNQPNASQAFGPIAPPPEQLPMPTPEETSNAIAGIKQGQAPQAPSGPQQLLPPQIEGPTNAPGKGMMVPNDAMIQQLPDFSKQGMKRQIPMGLEGAGGTMQGLYDQANKTGDFSRVKDLIAKMDQSRMASRGGPEPTRPTDVIPSGMNASPAAMDDYLRSSHANDDERIKQSFAQGQRETGQEGVRDIDYYLKQIGGESTSPMNIYAARDLQKGDIKQQAAQALAKMSMDTELKKQGMINQNTLDMHKLQSGLLDRKQEEEDANTHAKASNALFITELKKAQDSDNPETKANALKIATQQQATFNEKAGRDSQGKKIVPPSGKEKTPAGAAGPEAVKTQATSDVSRLFPQVGNANPEGLAQMLQSDAYKDPVQRQALLAELKSRPNWPQIEDAIHNHLGVKMMNAQYDPALPWNRSDEGQHHPTLKGFQVAPTGNRSIIGLGTNTLTTPYGKTVDITGADNKFHRILPGRDYEHNEALKAHALADFLRESRGLPKGE